MLRTFEFTAARDGDLYGSDIVTDARDHAEVLAVIEINNNWRTDYVDWDDMAADMDGCELIEHPTVLAQRIGLDALTAYRDLHDGLSDMIEEGRLKEADIPDDYAWLVEKLARIAGLDPGP